MSEFPEANRIVLRELRAEDEAQALAAHAELADEGFDFLLGPDGASYAELLATMTRLRVGEGLSGSQVPATFLGAFLGNTLVGRASIRHTLSDRLMRVGGHIGYAVRPQFRRRGFATAILRSSLDVARGIGIQSVLVTCDDSNVGSITVIERCGGEPDDSEQGPVPHKLRYWIPTAEQKVL